MCMCVFFDWLAIAGGCLSKLVVKSYMVLTQTPVFGCFGYHLESSW